MSHTGENIFCNSVVANETFRSYHKPYSVPCYGCDKSPKVSWSIEFLIAYRNFKVALNHSTIVNKIAFLARLFWEQNIVHQKSSGFIISAFKHERIEEYPLILDGDLLERGAHHYSRTNIVSSKSRHAVVLSTFRVISIKNHAKIISFDSVIWKTYHQFET